MQFSDKELGITVDVRRIGAIDLRMDQWRKAFSFMGKLEAGEPVNHTEGRQVGHYWLRDLSISSPKIGDQIAESWALLARLTAEVREVGWKHLIWIGIGGSALGPQLVIDALPAGPEGLSIHFIDNTDPDGIDRVLRSVDPVDTLIAVVSKSGRTKEPRNALREVRHFFEGQQHDFPSRAIAVTVAGSELDSLAQEENWLARLPLWNWVGGRTSVTGMVGLLPLAFADIQWRDFIRGAADMDQLTRQPKADNPALLLALAWYHASDKQQKRAMVVLPYKDRLVLFPRYLQQLIMESVGKQHDMEGRVIHHGLTVYGNKGATDQHAFVQQLRDGPDDFFTTFIAVMKDREGESIEVEPGITAGDYLIGFLLGTRNALTAANKKSLTITLQELDPYRLGALIALYERAVGLYAAHLGINAYDQPGVEAGKKAAAEALQLQRKILAGEQTPHNDDTWMLFSHLRYNNRL